MRENKIIRIIVLFLSCAVGAFIGTSLMYPWEFLQLEHPRDYADYQLVSQSYGYYCNKFGKKPQDLNFLPQYIVEQIGKPGFPITYNSEGPGELWYKASSSYYLNKRNLIDWLLQKNTAKISGVMIGRICPANEPN